MKALTAFLGIGVAFFVFEGAFGLYLLANGASFLGTSGPLIVQGFGCAAVAAFLPWREMWREG